MALSTTMGTTLSWTHYSIYVELIKSRDFANAPKISHDTHKIRGEKMKTEESNFIYLTCKRESTSLLKDEMARIFRSQFSPPSFLPDLYPSANR